MKKSNRYLNSTPKYWKKRKHIQTSANSPTPVEKKPRDPLTSIVPLPGSLCRGRNSSLPEIQLAITGVRTRSTSFKTEKRRSQLGMSRDSRQGTERHRHRHRRKAFLPFVFRGQNSPTLFPTYSILLFSDAATWTVWILRTLSYTSSQLFSLPISNWRILFY